MIYVAVYATIGAETKQMEGATSAAYTFGDRSKSLGAAKTMLANGFTDTHQFLTDDPTGSNCEVANF